MLVVVVVVVVVMEAEVVGPKLAHQHHTLVGDTVLLPTRTRKETEETILVVGFRC